jgi:hypothetical protein
MRLVHQAEGRVHTRAGNSTGTIGYARKRPDTVGQPQSAQNCASHMPSLRVQEDGRSDTVTAAVLHGNTMTNSIRPLSTHTPQKPILAPDLARKLNPLINVKLVGGQEVCGRYVVGIISQPHPGSPTGGPENIGHLGT